MSQTLPHQHIRACAVLRLWRRGVTGQLKPAAVAPRRCCCVPRSHEPPRPSLGRLQRPSQLSLGGPLYLPLCSCSPAAARSQQGKVPVHLYLPGGPRPGPSSGSGSSSGRVGAHAARRSGWRRGALGCLDPAALCAVRPAVTAWLGSALAPAHAVRCVTSCAPFRCSADADLTLLSKRAPPANAWRGKVVWIVGASQVGGFGRYSRCGHQAYIALLLPGMGLQRCVGVLFRPVHARAALMSGG